MWSERIALIEDRVAKLPPGEPPSDEDAYWHARMVAKLDGFLDSPAQTLRRYPDARRLGGRARSPARSPGTAARTRPGPARRSTR